MVDLEILPAALQAAVKELQTNGRAGVRLDAVSDNFAYIWIGDLEKQTANEKAGGWLRIPTVFPFANPHGLITIEPLLRMDGTLVPDGHNPGHQMCSPVQPLGAANYYSWTWQDCPEIHGPEGIVGVLHWYERRIRKG